MWRWNNPHLNNHNDGCVCMEKKETQTERKTDRKRQRNKDERNIYQIVTPWLRECWWKFLLRWWEARLCDHTNARTQPISKSHLVCALVCECACVCAVKEGKLPALLYSIIIATVKSYLTTCFCDPCSWAIRLQKWAQKRVTLASL